MTDGQSSLPSFVAEHVWLDPASKGYPEVAVFRIGIHAAGGLQIFLLNSRGYLLASRTKTVRELLPSPYFLIIVRIIPVTDQEKELTNEAVYVQDRILKAYLARF